MAMHVKMVVFIILICLGKSQAFIPAEILDFLIGKANTGSFFDFGRVSDTIVHEEILKRGVINSVARFFHDLNSSRPVKLDNMSIYYKDIRYLYYDFYGKWICDSIKLDSLLKFELQPNVAIVDFDPKTKHLPYAHFDAETFKLSNERVINFTSLIYARLANGDYTEARKLTGQILHTIQDFYSHSNWVEMGMSGINSQMGTGAFEDETFAKLDDETCASNCVLVNASCSLFVQLLASFLQAINYQSFVSKCPVSYYKCSTNVVMLDKLVSGYSTGHKLPDGSTLSKPATGLKCSHGGVLDADSMIKPAIGGINKDSGYYLFSPRADLHLVAAKLAINHTEHYFNQIRSNIGDIAFNKFLKITIDQDKLELMNNTFEVCGTPGRHNYYSFMFIFIVIIFNSMLIY